MPVSSCLFLTIASPFWPVNEASKFPGCAGRFLSMRILVILKYAYIGDAIVSLPLLKGICRQWPDARVTVMTSYGACKLLPLDLDLAPQCTFVPYGPRGIQRSAMDSVRLTFEMLRLVRGWRREGGFDIAFTVHRSGRGNLTAWRSGARVRAGFAGGTFSFLLNRRASADSSRPESQTTLELLKLFAPGDLGQPWSARPSLRVAAPAPAVPFPPPGSGPLIGIQPGASSVTKRWPVERMAALADRLVAQFGARLVLIGGPNEREPADTMRRAMQQPIACESTGEKLPETAGIMSRLDLFVGNDTGLNHMAAAAGCPTVCLFGRTSPAKWGRHYAPHRIVVSPDGTMEGITLEAAFDATAAALRAAGFPG